MDCLLSSGGKVSGHRPSEAENRTPLGTLRELNGVCCDALGQRITLCPRSQIEVSTFQPHYGTGSGFMMMRAMNAGDSAAGYPN